MTIVRLRFPAVAAPKALDRTARFLDEQVMHMSTPEKDDKAGPEDATRRERSAEERNVVAPTPKDVRAKAEDAEPEPPAADTQAP
ncbi:hypothetical protein [Kitasatospora herbaricolor]|uniref:hypothetical protein n=1 Tax=Kitasatospora herbaricolor TaxID=68217 RepID=UPI0027D7F659|nr:hypothetical protein [Kitasatospora herbaricolor]